MTPSERPDRASARRLQPDLLAERRHAERWERDLRVPEIKVLQIGETAQMLETGARDLRVAEIKVVQIAQHDSIVFYFTFASKESDGRQRNSTSTLQTPRVRST